MMDGAIAMTEAGRSNFIEILEQLEPLPELPDTGEDRFFSKEALDYQWPAAPVDSSPFPTWGSTAAEISVIGGTVAAAAASAGSTTVTPSPALSTPTPPEPTRGIKRALPKPTSQHQQPTAPEQQRRQPTIADRTVFLRQRLGGEILSSGNSSTSTFSDTASDDVAGDWELGSGVRSGGVRRMGKGYAPPFPLKVIGSGVGLGRAVGAVATSVAPPVIAAAEAGSQVSNNKPARRKRRSTGSASNERRKKSVANGPRESSNGVSSSKIGGRGGVTDTVGNRTGCGGRYASWDALVKPFKQQWDHIEPPPEELAAAEAWQGTSNGIGIGEVLCSRFSPRPQPGDTTMFSVEQCSARAHPTAVASYVLRVRCGSGAHIVRRTWDDLVTLCTMLGTSTPTPPRSDVAPRGVSDIEMGIRGGGAGEEGSRSLTTAVAGSGTTTTTPPIGLEFAPPDVLGREAASGFLRDLLERTGMVWATPTRCFLELEYLDGTLRGGPADDRRERVSRQVASVAASVASAVAATAVKIPITLLSGTLTETQRQQAARAGGVKNAFQGVPAPAPVPCLTVGAPPKTWLGAPRPALSLMAPHPDAARDLAAVWRCLGELGADTFSSMPFPRTWAATPAAGNRIGVVAPQRGGVAIVA